MTYSSTILADTPQAYYRCDDASGTIAHDATSNHYDATLSGGFTLAQPGAIAGDTDTSILFTQTGVLSLPYQLNYTTYTAFSLEFWINIASEWVYLAVTSTGSTTIVYMNGTVTATVAASSIEIAQIFDYAGATVGGYLDEIAIYNYVLTPTQILAHFSAGTTSTTVPTYYYGSFQINQHVGGLGYYLVAKDLDFPEFKPAISPLALYDGYKITGYQVGQRQIQVDLYVVGLSRIDCIARKDELEAALVLRDQKLVLHEDGRYWIANAISGKAKFAAGKGIVQCQIPVIFICANPYATAANAAAPYDSGIVPYTISPVAGSYQSPTFSVAGGGTIYTWPTITLTHQLATPGSTTLNAALTSGNVYTSITVVSSPALVAGQVIALSWTTGGNTFVQKLVVSGTVTGGATSIPVNSFTASASFPVTSTTVSISTAWNNVTISQLTDNYQIQANGNNDQTYQITGGNSVASGTYLLPQAQSDSLTIVCDPTASNGWTITGSVQGVSFTYPFNGAPPPLEPTTTQWQITIASDNQPTVQFHMTWVPRYAS